MEQDENAPDDAIFVAYNIESGEINRHGICDPRYIHNSLVVGEDLLLFEKGSIDLNTIYDYYVDVATKSLTKKIAVPYNVSTNGLVVTLSGLPMPCHLVVDGYCSVMVEDGFVDLTCDIPNQNHNITLTAPSYNPSIFELTIP